MINPVNTKGSKCFQYAVTEEIKKDPQRITKT